MSSEIQMKSFILRLARVSIILAILFAGLYVPATAGINFPKSIKTSGGFSAKNTDTGTNQVFLPLVNKNYIAPAPLWRFGTAQERNAIDSYATNDLVSLRLGWYLDYRTDVSNNIPYGMEFIPTVRVKQLKVLADNVTKVECCVNCSYAEPAEYVVSPSLAMIQATAAQHTGMTWLVGNEIDRVDLGSGFCSRQDEITPELYAQTYHDIYTAIKAADPTAQIAIGAMVQFTPLRREYLDKVWAQYSLLFGETMPVDVWNTHLYTVQEKSCKDPTYAGDCWGAEVPPEASQTVGEIYTMLDGLNFNIAWGQIVSLRKWMQAHGQQDKPLIITEYGVLWPTWLGCDNYPDSTGCPFTAEAVRDSYMYPSFNKFLNLPGPTDSVDPDDPTAPMYGQIGFPADGYRLVQRWNWFSLDYDEGDCENGIVYAQFGGNLYNSGLNVTYYNDGSCTVPPKGLTTLGTYWKQYVQNLPPGSTKPYSP
jgi:hypothetical protein